MLFNINQETNCSTREAGEKSKCNDFFFLNVIDFNTQETEIKQVIFALVGQPLILNKKKNGGKRKRKQ